MSNAVHDERGGTAALRATTALHPASSRKSASNSLRKAAHASSSFITPAESPQQGSDPSQTLSHAGRLNTEQDSNPIGNLDFPEHEDLARNELLHVAVFPTWRDDSGGDFIESPEEMQKKDPLGTQIWKLYSRTKTRLPNQERMENLTWRMMAMNLKRREQMQALYALFTACDSICLLTPSK